MRFQYLEGVFLQIQYYHFTLTLTLTHSHSKYIRTWRHQLQFYSFLLQKNFRFFRTNLKTFTFRRKMNQLTQQAATKTPVESSVSPPVDHSGISTILENRTLFIRGDIRRPQMPEEKLCLGYCTTNELSMWANAVSCFGRNSIYESWNKRFVTRLSSRSDRVIFGCECDSCGFTFGISRHQNGEWYVLSTDKQEVVLEHTNCIAVFDESKFTKEFIFQLMIAGKSFVYSPIRENRIRPYQVFWSNIWKLY